MRGNARRHWCVAAKLGEQRCCVERTVDDRGGAEREGARFLQSRRLVGDENDLGVLWSRAKPVLQRREYRCVTKVDVDESVMLGRRGPGRFQSDELKFKKTPTKNSTMSSPPPSSLRFLSPSIY